MARSVGTRSPKRSIMLSPGDPGSPYSYLLHPCHPLQLHILKIVCPSEVLNKEGEREVGHEETQPTKWKTA